MILELIYKAAEVVLTCSCLTLKKNRYFTFFCIWIPTSIIQIYSAYHNFDSVPLSLLMFAVFITLTCLLTKDKPYKKTIVTLFMSLICALISEIYFSLSKLRGITNYFVEDRIGTAACLVIMTTLEALFAILWNKKARTIIISGKDLAIFMLLPVSQAVISVLYQIIEKSNVWSEEKIGRIAVDTRMTFFIAYMFFCFITDFLIFYLILRISNDTREEEQIKFETLKSEMNMDYYRTLEQNSEQIHKLRHDIANYISVVGLLVENNDDNKEENKELAKRLVEEMNLSVSNIPNDNYCRNKIVNIILCQTAKKCTEAGIKYDFCANIPADIGIEEIDLCRALTNMIDNALNAAKKCRSGWISIQLNIIDGYLYLKIQNSFVERKVTMPVNPNHGYGKKILKDIAEKYNGVFASKKEDETYSALITLQQNNITAAATV